MGAATIAQRFVGSYKKEIHPPFRLRHRVFKDFAFRRHIQEATKTEACGCHLLAFRPVK